MLKNKYIVLAKMYLKTFGDKFTAEQSETTIPHDRWKHIYHKMIGDKSTTSHP